MAATGKKSKKAKWIPASITDIIAEPTTIPTINNWADSVDEEPTESFTYGSRPRAPVVLPSASRAARGGLAVDDESIPRRPPFIAHISNLPYDVDESAITELFTGLKITNLRLPREGDRLKGYGYVDFEDRDSLINAMNMLDLTISGRRIRIDVATQDTDRRMGRSGRSDRDREYDPERTMGDWRSGPRAVPEPAPRARAPERERERDSSADTRPGAWRDAERAPPEPPRAAYAGRDSFGRERYGDERGGRSERTGYGGRDGFRTADRDGFRTADRDGFRTADRDGFGSRDGRGFGARGFGEREREPPAESKPRERPKLNLLPRTLPREPEAGARPDDERAAPKPPSAEKVFGAAKPVDTASKEREIEERLRKQEEEARRATDDKERWGRRNDHSGDRRAGPRRDDRDRGRDSRSYNRDSRDRRDYSKDDKERRDYSRDDRDRTEYSRDDRDRRDYHRDRDERERRDADDGERRGDDRERRDYGDDDRRDARDEEGRDARDELERRERRDGGERRAASGERRASPERRPERASRSRERRDEPDERALPKLKEQEKPNFVASNKFSFLEDADDGGSD